LEYAHTLECYEGVFDGLEERRAWGSVLLPLFVLQESFIKREVGAYISAEKRREKRESARDKYAAQEKRKKHYTGA